MVFINVDSVSCDGCGECVKICPSSVYAIEDGLSKPLHADECTNCCACVDVCPKNAIEHESC
ncbi:MAG TPA: 4Fe-4S dicluster domain-containing protein [Euryarchaeota archaeon]|nr:4Fe-4S dicluster domain-containing protein [Euryarchaeota archaeon]HDY73737.1 4Fe-4S dicluster domain-containing protein [Euryarchaeota archaeon]